MAKDVRWQNEVSGPIQIVHTAEEEEEKKKRTREHDAVIFGSK